MCIVPFLKITFSLTAGGGERNQDLFRQGLNIRFVAKLLLFLHMERDSGYWQELIDVYRWNTMV